MKIVLWLSPALWALVGVAMTAPLTSPARVDAYTPQMLYSAPPAAQAVKVVDREETHTSGIHTIEGSVWYRERMALPPNAVIFITLEDVSRMDVASQVLASTSLAPQGGPPWTFSLRYDPRRLQDKRRYVLRARIEVDGHLLFTSTEHIPAFNRGDHSPVNMRVTRVAGGSTPPVPDVSLTETYWKLTEIDGEPAALGAGGREVHLVLTAEGARLHGFSGCNRFTGNYELNQEYIHFGQLASTRMACVEGMELEQRFLTLLAGALRYTITGEDMALYDSGERLMLRFRAIALP